MEETYEQFIQNILDTRGRFACGEEYHERHHIVPRCMDGSDDEENLIDLFAREHFIAHKLLAKEYPNNKSLQYSFFMMSRESQSRGRDYQVTPEEYEESKKVFSESISGENSMWYGTHRVGDKNPMYGKTHSQEAREKIRRAALNRSEETLDKIRQKAKERLLIPENNPMLGKKHSQEAKKKQSDKAKERFRDPTNHPMFGVRRFGKDNPRSRPVICIETMAIYDSAQTASNKTGIDNSAICKNCKGRYKTAGGYQWKSVYDIVLTDGAIIPGAITLGILTEDQANEQLTKQND